MDSVPRPGEVLGAIKDVFIQDQDQPPLHSVPGTSAFPLPSDPQSSLVFHPPIHRQPSPTSPDLSPGATDNFPSQLPTPAPVPTATGSIPPFRPSFDTRDIDIDHPAPLPLPFKNKAFASFRRGSLMPTSSPAVFEQNARRGSDPNTGELSRLATPRFTMSVTGAASRQHGVSGPARGKDKEVLEMTSVAFSNGNFMGRNQQTGKDDGTVRKAKQERSKEDLAMAKWRKWIVEQPIQPIPTENSPSPGRSRKSSPAPTNQSIPIPLVPLGATSPQTGFTTSPSFQSPRSPLATRKIPSRSNSDESRSTGSLLSPLGSRTSRMEQGPSGPSEIYATETVRALQDVELAVDENILIRNTIRSPLQARRMSTNPRVSETENPFIDLASRLSSRRVRPIVIELIQALGHYVDALWSTSFSDRPCPWIITSLPERRPSTYRGTLDSLTSESGESWKSRMITAVQEGKRSGHVSNPPTLKDVDFWEEEVRHALKEVDDVVGIYKGVGWAFNTAMTAGRYGEVNRQNVLGKDGRGGNYTRLLNDLEEAMWGDAPPRPTDLAYDLPADFDPYAIPDSADLAQSNPSGGLASFFSDGPAAAQLAYHASPVPEDIYNVALPDLTTDREEANSEGSAGPMSPIDAPPGNSYSRGSGSGADVLNLDSFRMEGETLSLEELGKRRHQEWLQLRRAEGAAW